MVVEQSQQDRRGSLTTAMSEDVLALVRFDGSDGVNELFEYRVEAVTAMENVDFDQLIGTNMAMTLKTRQNGAEGAIYFNGVVTEAQWVGVRESGLHYRFVLRPWLWLASQRRNQRIFHNKTVLEIISEVLGDYDGEIDDKTIETYPTLEYTVQYRETDLSFVRRLMERYGISFSFGHDPAGHVMLLTDANASFPSIGARDYIPTQGAYDAGEHLWAFGGKRQLTTGAVKVQGYNFKTPTARMDDQTVSQLSHGNGAITSYDFPGRHEDHAGATKEAATRTRQERVKDGHFVGQGHIEHLKSGHLVTLDGDHPADLTNGTEYLCIRAHHIYTGETYASGGRAGQKESFQGRYEFLGEDTQCVPERKTFDTRVQGPQTGIVVGGDGDEIDVDEYGRILVQFHWDMDGARSMRCRVAQLWAGAQWGAMFTPRIGMEVVVVFLEGDPDRPLVTGCVYNADNMPPFPLPAEKNLSGLKSDSTTGGGGYNEYVFDDTKDAELIRQHAQKDMHTKVLNCETREVDVDRTTTIGNDETREVGNDEQHSIGNDSTWAIGNNETREIGNNHDTDIGANETHKVGANRETTIGANETTKISGTTKITGTGPITIDSKAKITLKVASQKIELTPTGITISGLMIDVKATTTLNTQGLMATHKADAIMTVKGSIVMIN